MSCSSHAPQAETEKKPSIDVPPIHVNGVLISPEQIGQEAQNHPSDSLEEAIKKSAEALIIREVLLQKTKELSIIDPAKDEVTDAVEEAAITKLLDQEIETPKADEEACKIYFEANQDKFHTPHLVEATHILLDAAPDDFERRDRNKVLAEELIEVLKKDPNKFPDLAQQYSACPSKEVAGSLGQITKGTTVPEFEKRLFSLPQGLCEEPITSRYGHHIVRIDHCTECEPLPYEAVRVKIENYLNHQVYTRAVSQYIKIIVGEAKIDGIDMGVDSTPLVQ